MNKVILTGNLCNDVELKQTKDGKAVVTNCIAVQREYKNTKGEYDSDFINIVVWDNSAQYLGRYAHKGDRVELVGRWTVRKYTATDCTSRTVNECVVDSIRVFSRQPKEQAPEQTQPNWAEIGQNEDLPF